MRKASLYGTVVAFVCLIAVWCAPAFPKGVGMVSTVRPDGGNSPALHNADRVGVADVSIGFAVAGNINSESTPNGPYSVNTPVSCIPASACCKICSVGKACGNSCINREYTCHKGRGCACNSEEVCES